MADHSHEVMHEWNFGDDVVVADALKQLVLSGRKTATTGLWREGKILTPAGAYEAIVGTDGKRFCLIKVKNIVVKPFLEVDWEFAQKEGEDDQDLASWREKHRRIFHEWSSTFTDQSLVVCEEFEVVQILE